MGMCSWLTRSLVCTGLLLTMMGSLRADGPIRADNPLKDDPLKEVRLLYGTAAYEEALVALVQVDDLAVVDQVDEYRALCFLALHRDAEAEREMERLVSRHPFSVDGLSEQSPKFATVYRAVRTRLVPGLANSVYRSALAIFEAKDYSTAERQFGEALELLQSVQVPAAQRDWEVLAVGFRALARLRIAPVAPQPVLESTPAPVAMLSFPSAVAVLPEPFAPVPRVYDKTDLDVTPPIEIIRTMPPWNPLPQLAGRTYAGQLQLVVGKDGRVTSAEILRRSFSSYDWLLLRAVKQWQYAPALKRGLPVEYRQTFEYALKGI